MTTKLTSLKGYLLAKSGKYTDSLNSGTVSGLKNTEVAIYC